MDLIIKVCFYARGGDESDRDKHRQVEANLAYIDI